MVRSTFLFILLSFLFSSFALAQEETETIKISSSDVNNFIAGFPSIQKDLEALDVDYIDSDNSLTMPEGVEMINKVNNIVQKQGYADYYDFLAKGSAILSAYTAIELDREAGSIQPEIQEAIDEIERNPYMSAEQKKELKAALLQSSQAMEEYSETASTDENIAVVKPYTDQIRQMMEALED